LASQLTPTMVSKPTSKIGAKKIGKKNCLCFLTNMGQSCHGTRGRLTRFTTLFVYSWPLQPEFLGGGEGEVWGKKEGSKEAKQRSPWKWVNIATSDTLVIYSWPSLNGPPKTDHHVNPRKSIKYKWVSRLWTTWCMTTIDTHKVHLGGVCLACCTCTL
jgi:hypothetical protein